MSRKKPHDRKKNGGINAHEVLPLDNLYSELVWLTTASTNDNDSLRQLKPQKGSIYVFDKGYLITRSTKNG